MAAKAWMPFAFPSCPYCHRSWANSYHRACSSQGEVEVEPSSRRARCRRCWTTWGIDETSFYCACGGKFLAHEVASALTTAALMRQRLIDQIQSMNAAELDISKRATESMGSWLEFVGSSAGEYLGRAIGNILKWWRG